MSSPLPAGEPATPLVDGRLPLPAASHTSGGCGRPGTSHPDQENLGGAAWHSHHHDALSLGVRRRHRRRRSQRSGGRGVPGPGRSIVPGAGAARRARGRGRLATGVPGGGRPAVPILLPGQPATGADHHRAGPATPAGAPTNRLVHPGPAGGRAPRALRRRAGPRAYGRVVPPGLRRERRARRLAELLRRDRPDGARRSSRRCCNRCAPGASCAGSSATTEPGSRSSNARWGRSWPTRSPTTWSPGSSSPTP